MPLLSHSAISLQLSKSYMRSKRGWFIILDTGSHLQVSQCPIFQWWPLQEISHLSIFSSMLVG